jgi:4-diphosphocytidyl-2C-methyl-D-erythritol kinase
VSFAGLGNDLEAAALEEAPDLEERMSRVRAVLEREGAVLASLTGSGSAFFGLFERRGNAARAQRALASQGCKAYLARTLTAQQYRRAWQESLGERVRSAGRTTW